MRGFREVIGLSVIIVGVYLALNVVVIGSGLVHLLFHPSKFQIWFSHLSSGEWHIHHVPPWISGTSVWAIAGICFLIFPKLALGLSGFETGVAVMPLIQGDPGDDPHLPQGRIRNTRKLMVTAALVMSVLLLSSSLVTATLIDANELEEHGHAQGRALAYLAHDEGRARSLPVVRRSVWHDLRHVDRRHSRLRRRQCAWRAC